jgi:anti-sigma regulatory factor (Ser/Thr protein kinase)
MAIDIDADPALVGRVRHQVAGTLRAWGLAAFADDVVLIASELVGNAVQFASARSVRVLLKASEDAVLLEVSDGADQEPCRRQAREDDESGRGLVLVEMLADAWGSRHREGGGKVVWARVALPAVRSGVWCELLAANAGGTWLVGSFDAPGPDAARGWIRVSAHAYLAALHPRDVDTWLAIIERDVTGAMAAGGTYECQIECSGTTVVWSARPVRFLPVAGRRSLPTCAQMFPPFDRPCPRGTA